MAFPCPHRGELTDLRRALPEEKFSMSGYAHLCVVTQDQPLVIHTSYLAVLGTLLNSNSLLPREDGLKREPLLLR